MCGMTPAVATVLLPWQRVRVSGPSMVPTLRHGDLVLVRHGAAIRPGDLVLARYRSMPGRDVLKRAMRQQDGGWWLASDNPAAGGDSAVPGVADVQARVLLCWRGGRLRWLPRRVSRGYPRSVA
jgi:hypothetical protein